MRQFTKHNLDWLRFRLPVDQPLESYPFVKLSEGDRVVKRDFGDGVYWYVDQSGVTDYADVYELFDNGVEITRLDLCVDLEFSLREHSIFKKVIQDTVKLKSNRHIGSDTGYTYYFEGLKSKGLKVRFYQKGKQLNSPFERWYRLEFELHNPILKKYLKQCDSLDAILVDLLVRYTNLKIDRAKVRFDKLEDIPVDNSKRLKAILAELSKKGLKEEFLEMLVKSIENDKK